MKHVQLAVRPGGTYKNQFLRDLTSTNLYLIFFWPRTFL